MAKSRKKKNLIARYLTPFGLRQICDITLVIGLVMLIAGMIAYKCTDVVLLIGLCLFVVGALMAILRSVRIMTGGLNKRSPEYKSAVVNVIIMGVVLALALAGIIYMLAG